MVDYFPSLAVRKQSLKHRDDNDIKCIVFHTTGVGAWTKRVGTTLRRVDNTGIGFVVPNASPFDTILDVYQNRYGFSGHYVVGQASQEIARCVPHDQIAQHVSSARRLSYFRNGAFAASRMPPEWRRGWKPYEDSLMELAWSKGSVNAVSVGVEIVPDLRGIKVPLSTESLDNVRFLVRALLAELPSVKFITHHYAVHPRSRTTPIGVRYDLTNDHAVQVKSVLKEFKIDLLWR